MVKFKYFYYDVQILMTLHQYIYAQLRDTNLQEARLPQTWCSQITFLVSQSGSWPEDLHVGFSRGTDFSDGFCLHRECGILQMLAIKGGAGTLANGHGSQSCRWGKKCLFFQRFCFWNEIVQKGKTSLLSKVWHNEPLGFLITNFTCQKNDRII